MPAVLFLLTLAVAGYSFAAWLFWNTRPGGTFETLLSFHVLVLSSVFLTGAVLCATVRHYALRLLDRPGGLPPTSATPRSPSAAVPAPQPGPLPPAQSDLVDEVLAEHGLATASPRRNDPPPPPPPPRSS